MENHHLNPNFFDDSITPTSQNYSEIGLFSGQNQHHLMVILPNEHLQNSSYKELLGKILTSVQLPPQEVLFFGLQKTANPFSLTHLAEKKNCQKFIVFGISLPKIGIHRLFPTYQVQSFNNITFINSASLEDLSHEGAKRAKFALWNALKEMQGIK